MKITDMLQERAGLVVSMREIIDLGENMPQEKRTELDKMDARYKVLSASIETEQAQIERERQIGEFQNSARDQKPAADSHAAKFSNALRDPTRANIDIANALSQTSPTQAGYLTPPEQFVQQLIKDLDNNLMFRKLAKVLPPLVGSTTLGFPKRTSRMTKAAWGTELSAPTPDTALAYGKREFKPNPATAEILVSKTLLRNIPDVDGYVRSELGYANGVLQEEAYMTGDGVGKPLGVFTASADGISTARDFSTGNTTTAITFDGLNAAKYGLKEQYRKSPKNSWLFHRDAIKQLAGLKDGAGQYIWVPSAVADQPDRLLGLPFHETEYAPNTFTTGLYVGLLGDFDNYWIADSLTMQIEVLYELYARTNQIDYISRFETDGMPVLEEAFARVKLA